MNQNQIKELVTYGIKTLLPGVLPTMRYSESQIEEILGHIPHVEVPRELELILAFQKDFPHLRLTWHPEDHEYQTHERALDKTDREITGQPEDGVRGPGIHRESGDTKSECDRCGET